PSWSPTGDWLAYVSSEPEAPRPSGGYTVARFHWKADGVGVIGTPTRRHVWLVPGTGGAARGRADGDWDDDRPRVSPAGQTVAFRSLRTANRSTSATSELWTVPVDGGSPQLIVPAVGSIRMHAWSPDGRWIAYVGHRQGEAQGVNNDVWLVEVET